MRVFFYDISPGPELLEFPNSSCYCSSSRKNAELLLVGWALPDNAFLWERSLGARFLAGNLIKHFVNTAAYYRSDSIGHPSSGTWIGHPGR